MEKIIRLSLANIRKHKFEFVSLMILVMMCVLLIGSALSAVLGAFKIFPDAMKNTGSYENFISILKKDYDKEFENIMREHPLVEQISSARMLYGGIKTRYINKNGEQVTIPQSFITADNATGLERPVIDTTLTDEEISKLEHWVYMPYVMYDSGKYRVGDTFEMICNTKRFSFTVAGFYETLFLGDMSNGIKMIVSDSDYHMLKDVIPEYVVLAYNDNQGQGGYDLFKELYDKFEEYSGKEIDKKSFYLLYSDMEYYISESAYLLLQIIVAMAIVIVLSVIVMIRFRIAGDIKEQVVNIGVLKALGYTSMEITVSYVLEYLLMAGLSVIIGTIGCFMLTPVLLRMCELIVEHRGCGSVSPLPIFLTGLGVLVLVGVIAFIRAIMVRKYLPVHAFRKGQGDHRFGREYFPLSKTKYSVHFRFALKEFVCNFKRNIGLMVCITISVVAVVFSFVVFNVFCNGLDAIYAITGIELSDLQVELEPSSDAGILAEELEQMPEVRKVLPTSAYNTIIVAITPDGNRGMLPLVFHDFDDTENVFPIDGRFPKHDNEIMLTKYDAKWDDIVVGDSIILEHTGVKKTYIVSGVTTAMAGGIFYITYDGIKRLVPDYRFDKVNIYLEDGVDVNDFRYLIEEKYSDNFYGSEKEKNGDFAITDIVDMKEIMSTQLASTVFAVRVGVSIFMTLSAVVVMIILFILMESSVRQRRKEFAIMKGLGYTSHQLMFQLACCIVPSVIISVVIGTLISFAVIELIIDYYGKVNIDISGVIVLDIVILIFCFLCAFTGTRKIRKISVCELMTE